MLCALGRHLAGRFSTAARKYAEAAAKLGGSDVQQAEYRKWFEASEELVLRAEEARLALKRHIDEHRCGNGESVRVKAAGD
jgi:hypothetical protein